MSPIEKQMARIFFKLKIHEADGKAFETLFAQIMEYSRPEFTKIKPYGNQGDRGNDGYEKGCGRYFQVHAPEDPIACKNISKVTQDFNKLKDYWGKFCEVKEYFYVFNDKYRGIIGNIEEALAKIKSQHNLAVANAYVARHLEDEFIKLDIDIISIILGGMPKIDSDSPLDYSFFREIITYISSMPPNDYSLATLVVPDYEEKIQFNSLNVFGDILKAKQRETWQVDDYFSRNSEFTKQTLRDYMAGFYLESINKFSYDLGEEIPHKDIGDMRFSYMLKRIVPPTGNNLHDRLRNDAALIIMAKYFESCDIFEEPTYATSN